VKDHLGHMTDPPASDPAREDLEFLTFATVATAEPRDPPSSAGGLLAAYYDVSEAG